MDIEVRPCASLEEFRTALGAIGHFFGWAPDEEAAERFSKNLPQERMLGAWEGERLVGGAGAFPFEMSVPGGSVPTAGVTVVGVLPTHRRRGILTSMMRRQLDDARTDGEPVAALWAAEEMIYGRFGYGQASFSGEIRVARERTAFATPLEPRGSFRIVQVEEALETFPPVYEAARRESPGMMSRTHAWWELRRLTDPPDQRQGGGPLNRVLHTVDGSPAAYATYRVSQSFEAGVSIGHVRVLEAMGADPDAVARMWRYLLDFDWTSRIEAGLLPLDHPLLLLAAEPRRLGFRIGDGLWLRLVDVPAALGARDYAADGALTFEVRDDFLPENAGRWRLADGSAERTDEEADLSLSVDALSSAYLGAITFGQLARAGRAEELREGALARADAMFRADRAPWSPEIF